MHRCRGGPRSEHPDHQHPLERVDAGRNLVHEAPGERRRHPVERRFYEAVPGIERRIERNLAEGRQPDVVAAARERRPDDRRQQRPAYPPPSMVGMDGEFAEPLGPIQLLGDGESDRLVETIGRDQGPAAVKERAIDIRRSRRGGREPRIAVVDEAQRRRLLYGDQPIDLVGPGGADRGRVRLRPGQAS